MAAILTALTLLFAPVAIAETPTLVKYADVVPYLVETVAEGPTRNRFSSLAKTSARLKLSEVSAKHEPRIDTGIQEFDRVLELLPVPRCER